MQPGRLRRGLQAALHTRQRRDVQRTRGRGAAARWGCHGGQYIEPMFEQTGRTRPHLPQAVPRQCEVCRRWGSAALCTDCVGRYAATRPRCACCGLALGLATPRCGDCLRDAPPFSHTVCAADYGFPWDGLIGAFKFQGRPELAGPAGRAPGGRRAARVAGRRPAPARPGVAGAAVAPPSGRTRLRPGLGTGAPCCPCTGPARRSPAAAAPDRHRAAKRPGPCRTPAQPAQRLHGRPDTAQRCCRAGGWRWWTT